MSRDQLTHGNLVFCKVAGWVPVSALEPSLELFGEEFS